MTKKKDYSNLENSKGEKLSNTKISYDVTKSFIKNQVLNYGHYRFLTIQLFCLCIVVILLSVYFLWQSYPPKLK